MKPAAFDYVRAEHLDEVLAGLAREGGDARVIAGGQSLMPMLNMRVAKPKTLIDIMRLPELARIERKSGNITVGAGVRQATLLAWPELGEALRLVALALPWTGHVQTRSRGTVCGSIAHADPSAELPLLRRQTADFAGHRAKYGLPVTYEEIPGADHFTIMNEMTSPTGRITSLIRQLFERV